MNSGFVKLHRTLVDHPWLNDRPEWFQGWCHILMATNYQTGEVNLTETYRTLSKIYDSSKWRYFISKLVKDEMLEEVEAVNLGAIAGHRQTAKVKNWFEYNPDLRGANSGASAEPVAEPARSQQPTVMVKTAQERGASAEPVFRERGADSGVYKEYNLKEDKEIKELKHMFSDENENEPKKAESTEILVFSQELSKHGIPTKKTSELRNEEFSAARDEFYRLWNAGKPATAYGSTGNEKVDEAIKKHVKRLGAEEFLERTRLSLVFMRNDKYLSTEYRSHAITLLRHLDTYADKGRNHHGMSEADAKLTAFAMRARRAAENVMRRRAEA